MAFIGIITDPKNEKYTRNILTKDFSSQHEQILFIHSKNMNNIKNIRFESILFDAEEIFDEEIFLKLLSNCKNLLINSDIKDNTTLLKNNDLQVITFGFNQKSTVTISSITDECILMCIQRKIINIKGKVIEPQEIKINIKKIGDIMPNSMLGVQILRLIYGKI